MKKPYKREIREWLKDSITQWFLNQLAFHLNEIDTVRNIEKGDELLARKMAIEVIENTLADIYEAGEIAEIQKKISEDENIIIKQLKETKEY